MIVDDLPPIAVLGDDIPAIWFYEDFEGAYFVPVSEEPDQRRAWQRAEASTSVALVPDGRATVPVSDCEEGHYCREPYTCDAHPACPGTACPPGEPTDCWLFQNVDERDEFRAGVAFQWQVGLADSHRRRATVSRRPWRVEWFSPHWNETRVKSYATEERAAAAARQLADEGAITVRIFAVDADRYVEPNTLRHVR